jgi:hypothetical protein
MGRGSMGERTKNPRLLDFIILFSRIEYALKRSMIFSEPGRKISVPVDSGYKLNVTKANWSEFSKIIGANFFEERRACSLTKVLWEEPAGCWATKRVGEDVELLWHREDIVECESNSFLPVLRVRNCVFHGDSQEYIARHVDLVEASICVLEFALERCLQDQILQPVYDCFNNSEIY